MLEDLRSWLEGERAMFLAATSAADGSPGMFSGFCADKGIDKVDARMFMQGGLEMTEQVLNWIAEAQGTQVLAEGGVDEQLFGR